jgi:hypothetical protein
MLRACYNPALWEDRPTKAACEVVSTRLEERIRELLEV